MRVFRGFDEFVMFEDPKFWPNFRMLIRDILQLPAEHPETFGFVLA